MTSIVELFDNFSLKINIQIKNDKYTDKTEHVEKHQTKISVISWNIQEIDDECDFFQVPEENMNLIAYRQTDITFLDTVSDFKKKFQAPKNNPTFFTLKDLIYFIIEFEKETRQLTAKRTLNGEIDTENNVFQGLRSFATNDDQQIFTLKWSS